MIAAEHSAAASAERARDRASTQDPGATRQGDDANAAWRDEIATQRARDAHLIPDDVPPQLTPYCSKCQRGTKAHVCGPCQREEA